jgi:5-methylcytosine-specific restriction endonuclease McrA
MKKKKRTPPEIGKALTAKQKLRLKKLLFIEQHGKCYLCGKPVTAESGNLDHERPISKGGENHACNLRLTHPHCNSEKSNKMPEYMTFA